MLSEATNCVRHHFLGNLTAVDTIRTRLQHFPNMFNSLEAVQRKDSHSLVSLTLA